MDAGGGNVAFSDAVARARQIAAKLGTSSAGPAAAAPAGIGASFTASPLTGGLSDKGNPNSMPLGTKRAYPGSGGEEDVSAKKSNSEPDAITAQLRALADQSQQQQQTGAPSAKDIAKMAAQQVAAKLNQSIMGMGGGAAAAPGVPGVGQHAGFGLVTSEEWSIPNKVVGLVIGSKGECITQIQAQSGCRIQIAPDPPPGQQVQERTVSLNGTADAINKAKDLINKTINEAGHLAGMGGMGDTPAGQSTLEMMIPANKVGLIIGKGGETIKQLQNRTGCKMMMVQDGQWQNAPEKPLKITGDQSLLDKAKQIVQELMDSKDLIAPGRQGNGYGEYGSTGGGGGGGGMGGPGGANTEPVPVPREAVGIIIGKGGEMIKNIQGKFNVKVQFQNDAGGPQRICDISGGPNDVFAAKQHINELIAENASRMGGRGGGGGGRGGFGGGGGGRGGYGQDQTTMRCPSDRCGIVIGKGGENIRAICEMSGAHVELNRNTPPGPEKEFVIKGTPEQIQHAMHLISEKISVPPRGGPGGGPPGGPGGWGGPQGGGPYGGGGGGGPGGWNAPQGGPPGGGPPGGGYGGPPQQQPGWGNYNYNQWGQGGQQGGPQPGAPGTGGDQQQSQQSTDPAWQAYYANYYAQYQQTAAAGGAAAATSQAAATPASSQAQPATSQAAATGATTQSGGAAASAAQPKINPVTGEPDYTEAWANYYRQMGMHEQADAILKGAAPGGAQPSQ